MQLDVSDLLDIGRKRTSNQDRTVALPEKGIFAVIDGAGGSIRGDVAADVTKEALTGIDTTVPNEEVLRDALYNAHLAAHGLERGAACVVTVAWVDIRSDAGTYIIAHIGDTRAYHFLGGAFIRKTIDHGLVSSLPETVAMRHKHRNVVTRYIGVNSWSRDEFRTEVDIASGNLAVDEALLLVSDGVTGFVTSNELFFLIREHREGGADRVVSAIFEQTLLAQSMRGKGDNVSIVYTQRTA